MEHKKLLENVMIDLLKDPSCPIYQYQDRQLIAICQQLQLQNFSNIKDQDFQKKFAQFFIKYLETENEISNILEQSSIKRSDSKKMNEDYCSNQNFEYLQSKTLTKSNQELNKQKQDKLDIIGNQKKVKLRQSNLSGLLEIEENLCTQNSAILHQMIPQAQKLTLQNTDPLINNSNQDKIVQKEKTQKINQQKLIESNLERHTKNKKQIQIQQKLSRPTIDLPAEEGEIVIQIFDSESENKRNILDSKLQKGIYQSDDIFQVQSNKIQQKKNNFKQKTFNQQQNIMDMYMNEEIEVEKKIYHPQNSLILNQDQSLPVDRIKFEIQKKKYLLEKQYVIIQQQPSYTFGEKNSLSDFQIQDSALNLNPIHRIPQKSSNLILENQQFNQDDNSKINQEMKQKLPKYKKQFQNWNKPQLKQNKFQVNIQSMQIQNHEPHQTNNSPQSVIQSNRSFEYHVNLERLGEKKPKIEVSDICNNNIDQQGNQFLRIQTSYNQCYYCKQIDGKFKLIDIENEIKICYACLLEKLNPFKKIIHTLGFLEYQYQQKSQSKIHLDFKITQNQFSYPGLQLEIRCVILNKNGLTDFTFPNSCNLLINGVIIKEFKPLVDKSCLKKRKDHCILIGLDSFQNTYGIQKKYTFTCIEIIPDYRMRQEIPQQIYIFGLSLVLNQGLEQIVNEAVNQSILSQIKTDIFKNEIKIDKSKVSLVCQYSFDLIKIPARGEFCQHQQCFCLNSYLEMMIHAEHMKWICPICKKCSISLRIDHYQWGIIKKILQLNIKVDQITVDQNGILDSKDPLFAIIQNNQINSYNDLISQGYTQFEKNIIQLDNDNEISTQNPLQIQGQNQLNAILID